MFPFKTEPPITPPFKLLISFPGRLISKDLAIKNWKSPSLSTGEGIISSNALKTKPILAPNTAEIGIMGAFSAMVPLTNSLIC